MILRLWLTFSLLIWYSFGIIAELDLGARELERIAQELDAVKARNQRLEEDIQSTFKISRMIGLIEAAN